MVARRAHNPKVVSSNLAPATNVIRSQIKHLLDLAFCVLVLPKYPCDKIVPILFYQDFSNLPNGQFPVPKVLEPSSCITLNKAKARQGVSTSV